MTKKIFERLVQKYLDFATDIVDDIGAANQEGNEGSRPNEDARDEEFFFLNYRSLGDIGNLSLEDLQSLETYRWMATRIKRNGIQIIHYRHSQHNRMSREN